jgi:O-antigen/teichoic acid export membrane protein
MSLARSRNISGKNVSTGPMVLPGIWHNGMTVCSLLITASIYIIIARALGPQIFGSYLFVQWVAMITVPMIGTGMSTLVSRQIAEIQSHEPPRLIAGVFYFLWYRQHRSILLYCLIYLLLSFFLAHFFHLFTSGLLLLVGLSTLPLLLSGVAGTTLRSMRRTDLLSMLHLFYVLLALFFVIVATQINGEPIEGFILAFALSSTLTLVLSVICIILLLPLKHAVQPGIFLHERLTDGLNHSWFTFILDAIIWQRSELLLLVFWHRPAELGFYALSTLISAKIIGLAPALFSRWLFPLFMHYMPEHRYLSPYDAFIKTSCYITFLAVPICTLLMVFSPTMVLHSLGSIYLPIVQPLRILFIATVFGSIATVSLTHLAGNKHICTHKTQHIQRWLNVGVVGLKISLIVPAIILWGITGAAIASTIAQIMSAVMSILLCNSLLKRHDALFYEDIL